MIWPLRALLAVIAALISAQAALAQSEGLGIAAQLPVEVPEVVSGGAWIDGTASGSYRTVTVQIFAPVEHAEVFLQWVGSRTPAEPLRIISSVPLREFNDKKFTSASITLEADADGSARIVIAGQAEDGRAVDLLEFSARQPGQYEVVSPRAVEDRPVKK